MAQLTSPDQPTAHFTGPEQPRARSMIQNSAGPFYLGHILARLGPCYLEPTKGQRCYLRLGAVGYIKPLPTSIHGITT